MIDKSRPSSSPAATPPSFVPVPRRTARHDGWTPERQQGFIEALMATGSVRAAAHAVNMAPEGAYALRRHPQAGSFRKAWEAALGHGIQRLEDLAMERALNGQDVPVYSYGKLVGTRRVYNDRLIMFLLRNRAPARFPGSRPGGGQGRRGAAQAGDPAQQRKLERLRRQWRAEWEAEQEAEAPSPEEIRLSIENKLAAFRRDIDATMSDRTRALYEAAQAAHEEDRRQGYYRFPDEEDDEEHEQEGGDTDSDSQHLHTQSRNAERRP